MTMVLRAVLTISAAAVTTGFLLYGLLWPTFAASTGTVDTARQAQQQAMLHPADNAALNKFLATLGESGHGPGSYVVEGDVSMTQDEVRDHLIRKRLEAKKSTVTLPRSSKELIVHVLTDNSFDYWAVAERALTYTIDRNSFPSPEKYKRVQDKLRDAAAEWVGICPECGVSFEDVTEDPARNASPRFRVKYQQRADNLVAESFFPSYAESRRVLFIYPEFFNTTFDPVGVFRHELGHILGYAHEHIQNIAGCVVENLRWQQLSDYTPKSVMHYFCGNGGSWLLGFQVNDIEGHRCLYKTGRPCPVNVRRRS